jgi:predicted dehydrogenase/threonine dehydrogenase-like Zn-dependent dehydrogenase
VRQVAFSGGEVKVLDVPAPVVRPGWVLVRNHASVISVGTESAAAAGGGHESLLLKAIRNPALVRKVVDRVSTHGLTSTVDVVRARLANDQALGYSCAGTVLESGAPEFAPSDRVACAGAGWANHAEVVAVPRNLVARVPEGLGLEDAAFATLAAIALQGVRRAAPTLGERIAVVGLGLLGQITAQILRASGALVTGVDVRRDRVERSLSLGMDGGFATEDRDLVAGLLERTDGRGADAVIVTAAGGDAALLNRSFEACRRKGRVVLVGDVPIRIARDRIYRKEIDFLISTSYGPGRYDADYEEKGHDYPLAYVRWTEGRNLEEAIRLMASGALRVRPLVDAAYPVERAPDAYASLAQDPRPLGVVLTYHGAEEPLRRVHVPARAVAPASGTIGVGVVGYGSHVRGVLLPLLKAQPGVSLVSVCSRNPLTVRAAAGKEGFARGTTDYQELLRDPDVRAVFVATRHDQHAAIAGAAVEAGKAVFVEKPMTLTAAEGRTLADLVARRGALLTVGFNRRFSPHVARLREALAPVGAPKTMVCRVDAGALPDGHWLLDPVEGGGRLLGEGVHFLDLMRFLAGSEVRDVVAAPGARPRDEGVITLLFEDGSRGTLVYAGTGSAGAGKERLEVFAGGATFVLDDFRSLEGSGTVRVSFRTRTADKGQAGLLGNFFAALRGEEPLGVTAEDGWRATWCVERAVGPPPAAAVDQAPNA